jgi:hypothetical protein
VATETTQTPNLGLGDFIQCIRGPIRISVWVVNVDHVEYYTDIVVVEISKIKG